MEMLIMEQATASALAAETAEGLSRLEPRKVGAGLFAGMWALPARVIADPAYVNIRAKLMVLEVAPIDPGIAWPPLPED